jgi:hypothetical protein
MLPHLGFTTIISEGDKGRRKVQISLLSSFYFPNEGVDAKIAEKVLRFESTAHSIFSVKGGYFRL